MEHHDKDESRWVDERMASLDPGDWQPDSPAALARTRNRAAAKSPRSRWWLWVTVCATAATVAIAFLVLSAPPACANPLGCKSTSPAPAPSSPQPAPVMAESPAPAATAPAPAPVAKTTPPVAHKNNYKETGSPTAPIVCELYTDYECPHCALFVLNTLPQLEAAYVKTGKVRLIHRDFPLPQHQYARLAALYADAAGELGYYQTAVTQLFRTQGVWSGDGDIALQLAPVLPRAILEKVRDKAMNDNALAAAVYADVESARAGGVNQTPSLVVEAHGDRKVIPGAVEFSLLKSYLDELLAK